MAPSKMDGLEFISKHLTTTTGGSGDPVREMLKAFAEKLMSAEADAMCGAAYGERSDERVTQRNGYRERPWDTRTGTVNLEIPKLRSGTYYPDWLLEPRRRGERAMVTVIAECYQRGVSTRRVDGLVKAMGIEGISKSQVSNMCQELDGIVEDFRSRPLSTHKYPYLWVDALVHKSREGGRIVNVCDRGCSRCQRRGPTRDTRRGRLHRRGRSRMAGLSAWPSSTWSRWRAPGHVGRACRPCGRYRSRLSPAQVGSAVERTSCATC